MHDFVVPGSRRRALPALLTLALALSGCSRATRTTTTFHPSPTTQSCAALANPHGPGTLKFATPSVATVNKDYGQYPGVSRFLRLVGTGGSIVFCSLDNPAPSLHGCRNGRTMFLVASGAKERLQLPCGAEPGVPRTDS
jgi:hypothetical protein